MSVDFVQIQSLANYLWEHQIDIYTDDYTGKFKEFSKQEVQGFVSRNFEDISLMRSRGLSWNRIQLRHKVYYPGRILNYWFNKESVKRNGRKIYRQKRKPYKMRTE